MTEELEFNPLENVLPAFITPIGRFRLPEHEQLDAGLTEAITGRAGKQRAQSGQEYRGWQSAGDILDWPQAEITRLAQQVRSAVRHMIKLARDGREFTGRAKITAWARLHEAGAEWPVRHHPMSHWTCLYFAEAKNPAAHEGPQEGQLIVQDPRGAAVNMMPHPGASGMTGSMTMAPEAGLLLIFPAWLGYGFQPLSGDGRIIVIGFNAALRVPADPLSDFPVALA